MSNNNSNIYIFPNEILVQIIKKLDIDQLYQCMYVNKRWLALVQSILFHQVSIDLVQPSRIFNMIRYSKTKPGKWVKQLSLQGWFGSNTTDSIYVYKTVMKHCPNVEKVQSTCINWEYFYTALTSNDHWITLKALPEYTRHYNDQAAAYYYYRCVVYLRKTLTELHLMYIDFNYQNFKDFPKLTKLKIDQNIMLTTLYQVEEYMDYLPCIIELDIAFSHIPYELIHSRSINRIKPNNNYNHVKIVTFRYYTPYRHEEEMLILEKFTNINKLTIFFSKLCINITPTFFEWACKSSTYNIQLQVIDEDAFMMLIYNLKNYQKDSLSIRFTQNIFNLPAIISLSTGIRIYNSSNSRKMNVNLVYYMKCNYTEQLNKAFRVKVKSLKYFNDVHMENYQDLFAPTI